MMNIIRYLTGCLRTSGQNCASFEKCSGRKREESVSMTESDSVYSKFPSVTSYASEKTVCIRGSIGFDNSQHNIHSKIDKTVEDFGEKCKDVVDDAAIISFTRKCTANMRYSESFSTNVFNGKDSKLEIDIKNCDHLNQNKATFSRPETQHSDVNTGGTKISETFFSEGYYFQLRLDSDFEDWYVVDVIEDIQQSKPIMIDSKATQTEWKDDSLIVRELVMNKFSDALERHLNRSLQRKQKRLQRFPIERFQDEDIKTEQACAKSEYSGEAGCSRNGGMLIRSENCKAEDLAQESLMSRSKTEKNENNILQQKCQQKSEISDEYPSVSPKFNSTRMNFSCNEVTDKLKHTSSIGDSESSLLLSRRTPIISIPKSTMIFDGDSKEDTPVQQKHKYNNKKDELLKSFFVNYETLVQSTKGITFCENSNKFIFTSQHVELERLLLISKLRNEAVAKEWANQHCKWKCNYNSNNSGSVFVTNIALPGKLSKKSKKITTWYVCTVSCGTEIFGTAASQPKANGDVVFDEEFEIKTRSYNFEITITIYAMTLPNYKEKSNFLRFNLSRAINTYTAGFRTLTAIRKAAFLPCSKIIIDLKDLKKSDFNLPQIPRQLNLLGILNVSLRAEPMLSNCLKSFLHVGKRYDSGIVWNRFWCCFEGKIIKLYKYPQDENEDRYVEALELDRCTSPAIKITGRRKTLLIEFVDKSEKEPAVTEIYLSTDLVHETDIWLKCINRVFTSLESWNCLKC